MDKERTWRERTDSNLNIGLNLMTLKQQHFLLHHPQSKDVFVSIEGITHVL